MAVAETRVKMTLAQFATMPPPEDARFKLELVAGEVIEVTRPKFEHNEVAAFLLAGLVSHVCARSLGRVSYDIFVLFDPDAEDSLAPGILFLANDHLDRLRDGKVWGPPDLVVEVLSPSTWQDDYGRKFVAYHRGGIPWYWIVDPEFLRIEEYQHAPEGYLRTQTVLKGQPFRPGLFPDLVLDLAAFRAS